MKKAKLSTLALIAASVNLHCINPPKPTADDFIPIVERSGGTLFTKLVDRLTNKENHKYDFEENWLTLDGKRLNVFQYTSRSENAGTILFMNTLLEPNSSSTKFAEGMSEKGWNILMMDFLGTGRSEGDSGVFSVEQNLRSIDALVEYAYTFSDTKPIYIGSSQGGEMGYLYACSENAEKISCYILHGVYIPSLDIAPHDAKLALARTPDGKNLIKDFYPDTIPLVVLVDPMNFYGSMGIFQEEVMDNPEYRLAVDTTSYLDFVNYKPGPLNPNVPVVIAATRGDKVVDYETRAIRVFVELSKLSKQVEWYEPGIATYPDAPRTSKFIQHMAFDIHPKVLSGELDVCLRYALFPEEKATLVTKE